MFGYEKNSLYAPALKDGRRGGIISGIRADKRRDAPCAIEYLEAMRKR